LHVSRSHLSQSPPQQTAFVDTEEEVFEFTIRARHHRIQSPTPLEFTYGRPFWTRSEGILFVTLLYEIPSTSRRQMYKRLRFLIEFGIDLLWKKWYKRSFKDESVLEEMQAEIGEKDAAPKTLKLGLNIATLFIAWGSRIVISTFYLLLESLYANLTKMKNKFMGLISYFVAYFTYINLLC